MVYLLIFQCDLVILRAAQVVRNEVAAANHRLAVALAALHAATERLAELEELVSIERTARLEAEQR